MGFGPAPSGCGSEAREVSSHGFCDTHGQGGYAQRCWAHPFATYAPELGYEVRRPETLTRWLGAYAAASSNTISHERLRVASTSGDGDQPAKTTTIAYRDNLSQLWLLDPVPGWTPANNAIRRLQQAPKHQLADPALAARLLGLSATTLLEPGGAHMAGPLFESLVPLALLGL